MLNFRKLRQDFSSNILKEGKSLYEKGWVVDAKILHLDSSSLRLSSRIKGAFENVYECEIEIDRSESQAVDSNCDCTHTYDCQHIAALLYFLEENISKIVVAYSQETDLTECKQLDEGDRESLKQTFQEAEAQEEVRKDESYQKELLSDYVAAAKVLRSSPFFFPPEKLSEDQAELSVVFSAPQEVKANKGKENEVQLALRLPYRSKPLSIPNVKAFFDAVRYKEPIYIGGKKYLFTLSSFDPASMVVLEHLLNSAKFYGAGEEKYLRVASLGQEALGTILAKVFERNRGLTPQSGSTSLHPLPCLYQGTLEEPLCFSNFPARVQFEIEYLEAPAPTFMLKPSIVVEEGAFAPEEVVIFESATPGVVHKNTYYRFSPSIKRVHLRSLARIRDMAIPQPLFGTFIENALPNLRSIATLLNPDITDPFVTLPYVGEVKGRCQMHYLNGELEAKLFFNYDGVEIPASFIALRFEDVEVFSSKEGSLARNLVEEKNLTEEIFRDFLYDEKEGVYRAKSEKKIVEFMTEVIPKHQGRVTFECPENLSDQFIYGETAFELALSEGENIDKYQVELKVDGALKGVALDRLWECLASKKTYLELSAPSQQGAKVKKGGSKIPRILVLDLEQLAPLIHIFDEIGIVTLDNHTTQRPLWSLTGIDETFFAKLPLKFSMTKKLKEIQKQMLGESSLAPKPIPADVNATLRNYQKEGVHWLSRLRDMHLGGILADDMGLGKTLQAICAITQSKLDNPNLPSLIVCPTSLVYNWKEEFHKFNPKLKVLVVDGIPATRKRLLEGIGRFDVIITSYNLLQKDIETYCQIPLAYAVLDEAQHIKNRGTRNAKSVKRVQAMHRLVLTGTPIENSLEELWSLFDFLMSGLLGSFDRFVEKYIRNVSRFVGKESPLDNLRRKVSPFILRRMKEDVLDDLPPITEVQYRCHLSDTQRELYHSYAASAKEELSKLVAKEGFDKVQIHVLATLTRLKQICCHPAIFAKEGPEEGDSAKYDMLMELLPSLIEGNHKTVIFSQYTRMLQILKKDLEKLGIQFAYLDGSSKNRLKIVNEFNERPELAVFLVSLKAGGAGLNLVGADTVIHYDRWWNPAVEMQATGRVHRIGQKKSVSSYIFTTLGTIEEKIVMIQNRKKGLVKKVITNDDEVISKLTWEEVLELLQV